MSSKWKSTATAKEGRTGDGYRKMAIASCATAISALVPVTLFQLGILENLPDPPGQIFNSKRIVISKSAHPLGIPDGILGLTSFSITLALLLSAKPSHPLVRGALRAKLLLDTTVAVRKARSQRKKFGQVCSWCLVAAAATVYTAHCVRMAREADRHPSR